MKGELALGDLAEPLGFDSLWCFEHHFTSYMLSPNPLQTLTYFAGRTSRIQLGTMVVGVSGVAAADFEKLQTTHKLTTPLMIAEDKDGPEKYKLNKEAAVTVLVYQKTGAITKSFAFKDTRSAAEKSKDIATAAAEAVK